MMNHNMSFYIVCISFLLLCIILYLCQNCSLCYICIMSVDMYIEISMNNLFFSRVSVRCIYTKTLNTLYKISDGVFEKLVDDVNG